VVVVPALGDPPPEDSVEVAARVLGGGGVVAVPTDTIYGLAVDPFRPGATARLFAAKGRPRRVPLPVLVAGLDQAEALAGPLPPAASALAERFWPGALTLVLPRRPGLDVDLGDEGATIGLRAPDHPVPVALCRRIGPLATTSANFHGEATPGDPHEVARLFESTVDVVLDGGRLRGRASTVVDCTTDAPRLLREGEIAWEEVQSCVGD
jgi:L-threonylcarbamoyladenylate synthase